MAEYRYKCTKVVTTCYEGLATISKASIATLSVIPDGSHWQDRPPVLEIAVPDGTSPGATYRVVIEEL